jgi:hypothetical protein
MLSNVVIQMVEILYQRTLGDYHQIALPLIVTEAFDADRITRL